MPSIELRNGDLQRTLFSVWKKLLQSCLVFCEKILLRIRRSPTSSLPRLPFMLLQIPVSLITKASVV